jgi:hypothetical protein
MNADDFSYGYEQDRDPAYGLPPRDGGSVDITRLHTARLVPPDVAQSIALGRQERAGLHLERALRLRQMAGDALRRFETSSSAAMEGLNEWLFLQDVLVRTPVQERRFAVLTRELVELDGVLERQWEKAAGMLHEAVNHEVSAQMLARPFDG